MISPCLAMHDGKIAPDRAAQCAATPRLILTKRASERGREVESFKRFFRGKEKSTDFLENKPATRMLSRTRTRVSRMERDLSLILPDFE